MLDELDGGIYAALLKCFVLKNLQIFWRWNERVLRYKNFGFIGILLAVMFDRIPA